MAYFDIFNHPLSRAEIISLCGGSEAELNAFLSEMIATKTCYEHNGYYAIRAEIGQMIEDRLGKEKEAQKYVKKVPFFAKLIRSFPFVKGVAISGSLSKNVMQKDGDIDYFIITTAGRLWICRTFLVAFKKIVLFNSKKYFCVNYFVDEENLLIPDQNIFTAIEISHLFPVCNLDLMHKFKQTNGWTKGYVEDFMHPLPIKAVKGKSWFGRFVEFLFKGKWGDRFDLYLMKYTYRKWEKKFKHFDAAKFDLTMRTNRGVSKHHPRDFQNRVLAEYASRLEKLGLNE